MSSLFAAGRMMPRPAATTAAGPGGAGAGDGPEVMASGAGGGGTTPGSGAVLSGDPCARAASDASAMAAQMYFADRKTPGRVTPRILAAGATEQQGNSRKFARDMVWRRHARSGPVRRRH